MGAQRIALDLAVSTFGQLEKYVPANDNHQGGRYIGLARREESQPVTRDVPDQEARQGDWMQTYTGRQFWPLDPRSEEVVIDDIAHSLSLQCRYAGHCRRFYSVAEHSVLLARWLRGKYGAMTALYGLLHDASEAYLVDVPRPVKPSLTGYKEVEAKVQAAVFQRFGLPADLPDTVHDADNRIIGDELVNLQPMEWHARHSDKLGVPIMLWSPAEAEEEFMWTFRALMDQTADVRGGKAGGKAA
ncbi:hypothetical protein DEM27_08305 [Metarhizobium album]|uniref:Phosphohydrolase n=2 Tax=Metarhizobium album TaxID=2182425 RepID=A0A2U2DUB1_9HYPH|nr:hypothetical protein DEM27_08305 [Rhizobium album]